LHFETITKRLSRIATHVSVIFVVK